MPLPAEARTGRRLVPVLVGLAIFMAGSALLRLVLLLRLGLGEHASAGAVARVFAVGLRTDLAAASWLLVLPVLVLALLPERAFRSRAFRAAVHAVFAAGVAAFAFSLAVEWFFFQEFD